MVFENTPSSRVQHVGRADLQAPGCCILCGTGDNDEGFVNFGTYIDYHGQVYLCYTCTIEVAEVIGCLIPAEAVHLKELANNVQAQNVRLNLDLDAANERLHSFDLILGSVRDSSAFSDLLDPATKQVDSDSTDDSNADSSGRRNGESEVTESDSSDEAVKPNGGASGTKQSKLHDVTAVVPPAARVSI